MTIGEIQFEQVQPSIGWPPAPQWCVQGVGSGSGVWGDGKQSAPEGPEVVNSYPSSSHSTTGPPTLTQPFANLVPGGQERQFQRQCVTEVPGNVTCSGVQQAAGSGSDGVQPGDGLGDGLGEGVGVGSSTAHVPVSL